MDGQTYFVPFDWGNSSIIYRTDMVDISEESWGLLYDERYAGKVESEDMYASIDLVIDKLDRQVRDRKNEANDRKRHAGGVSQLDIA